MRETDRRIVDRLKEEYRIGLDKGLITTDYKTWHDDVCSRIDKLFHTGTDITDTVIVYYLSEEPYENLIKDTDYRCFK